jgi:molecular chaperone DnaK (HSP70)
MAKAIGIDLGTTNSCVAVMEGSAAKVIENAAFSSQDEEGGRARVYSKALVEENGKKRRRQDRVPRRQAGLSSWR